MQTPEQLNKTFGLKERLSFRRAEFDLIVADLDSGQATARFALHGGQPLAFKPKGQQPVLWMSAQSSYGDGEAIRGGIPICWPWFGAHPSNPELPSHGFARTMNWSVEKTEAIPNGGLELTLILRDSAETREIWSHSFALRMRARLTSQLEIFLEAENRDSEPISCGAALHSYFNIHNIQSIAVRGLENRRYIDTLDGDAIKRQTGEIKIDSEVDRIYLETQDICRIEDEGLERTIQISKEGSQTTVVWNPWIDKSASMSNFGADEYREMVCVETVNTLDDTITIPPGGRHLVKATISVE